MEKMTAPIPLSFAARDDDRATCTQCDHLRGHTDVGWRCVMFRAAGVAPELPADLIELPQRCPAYQPVRQTVVRRG
jgi:hypothetical protein